MMTGMFTPFAIIVMMVLLDAADDDDHCGLAGAGDTTGSLELGLCRSGSFRVRFAACRTVVFGTVP
jgi:hypothetical protein